MNTPAYLSNEQYNDMLDALETAHTNGLPEELRTRLIIILGEIGNVWPASAYTGDEQSCERNENARNNPVDCHGNL